jgi:hypothetical protein
MPKRLKKSDKSEVYFAYRLGLDNGTPFYGDILETEGQFVSFDRYVKTELYGKELNYNALILFEINDKSQFFDEFTKFWIKSKPLSVETTTNYVVNSVSKPENGLITIYLRSLTTNNSSLWYEYKGKIIETQMQFDENTLTAIAPPNMYLPWKETTKIWYEEPDNATTKTALLRIVKKDITDLGTTFKFRRV